MNCKHFRNSHAEYKNTKVYRCTCMHKYKDVEMCRQHVTQNKKYIYRTQNFQSESGYKELYSVITTVTESTVIDL